jgi:2-polyprenyl-3-methyl-5-hydroxy-6-metoxy-1,4-benzoquinol methylase
MLYDIKNDALKYWLYFDELGDKADFEFIHYSCACGHDEKVLIGNTTRHRNQFDLYQCQYCGTLRIDPYLTDASVEKYYANAYGKIKRRDIPAQQLFNRQKKSAGIVWEKVSPFLKTGDKVLDFGGGAGGKVMEILAQGYEVYIKEVDQKYFEFGVSQGLKPYAAISHPALDAGSKIPQQVRDVQPEKFEFIVLSRVLEHMNQPVEFLKYFKSDLLKEGGHIYLEVPLIENSRGDYLLNEIHISHKFYFSHLSLKEVCALAGFAVAYESRNLLIITPSEKPIRQNSAEMLALSNKVLAELG